MPDPTQTPETSASPYCSPADFLARFDARLAGDLCSDDGTRVAPGSLPSNPAFLAALADASGELESAASASRRYSPADLAAIVAAGGNGASIVKRLVAALALGFLRDRRGLPASDMPEQVEAAREQVKKLRDGEAILPTVQAMNAGLPQSQFLARDDYERLNLVSNQARIFGDRTPPARRG